MARSEAVVLTNMCMIYDGQGNILVQARLDPDWPGVAFPGGHVESGESFVTAMIREVWEETGLTIEKPQLCGVKQFQRADGVRYIVLFFKTSRFSGELTSSEEGEVFWIKRSDLGNYQLVDGFEDMLKVFESEDISECYYENMNGAWQCRLL